MPATPADASKGPRLAPRIERTWRPVMIQRVAWRVVRRIPARVLTWE